MTLQMSNTRPRSGVGNEDGPTRQPLVARTGPGDAAEAARTLPVAVGSDVGTPR